MAAGLGDITQDALQLDPADRAKLIDTLYTSLQPESLRARETAWVREAESRLSAFKAGRIHAEPWGEVKARVQPPD